MLNKFLVVKKMCRSIVVTALFLVVVSIVSEISIKAVTADADNGSGSTATYYINNGVVYIGDPSDGKITECGSAEVQCLYVFKYQEACNLGEQCYYFPTNESSYPYASIRPPSPEWLLLHEALERAEEKKDSAGTTFLKSVINKYAQSAFIASGEFTWGNNKIFLRTPELFSDIYNNIDYNEPNLKINNINETKVAELTFSPTYQNPSKESAWLKTVKFLQEEAIPYWETYGIQGLSGTESNWGLKEYLLFHSELYLSQCETTNSKGGNIDLTVPYEILLNDTTINIPPADAYSFSVKINAGSSRITSTKIFIKPSIRSGSDDPYLLLGPYNQTEFSVSWQEVQSKSYQKIINGAPSPFAPSSALDQEIYNKQTPQKYIIKAVVYEGQSIIESVTSNFQTVNAKMIVGNSQESEEQRTGAIPTDGWLLITPTKTATYNGESLGVEIKVRNNQEKSISKVVAYVCKGDKQQVENGDSSNCTYFNNRGESTNNQDAIKAKFVLKGDESGITGNFQSFTFDPDQISKMSFDWNTSGSTTGVHAIMVKAFKKGPSGEYLPNSKRAATVTVYTNASRPLTYLNSQLTGSGNNNKGIMLKMNTKASDNPYGSPIRDTEQLLNRVIKFAYLLIGGLAAIAIIIGGIQFISSAGNQDNAIKGKKTILFGAIGIMIAIMTFVIEAAVIDIINKVNK